MAIIDEMLRLMVEKGASDLHVYSGEVPVVRVNGSLVPLEPGREKISEQDLRKLLHEITNEEQRHTIENDLDLDFSYHIHGVSRFRANYFFQQSGISAVFRRIPEKIESLDALGMPPVLKKLTQLRKGLVLVTGPTGSGKSTTLAAMIDEINRTRKAHILTIEDPVEFVHAPQKSRITQREVNTDTKSFAAALREAARMDPDVVLVGEMRDLITTGLTLKLAEMGSLVFATVHTNSTAKTIDRIINIFPQDERDKSRIILSEVLRGIVSQQILRKKDGSGRVVAMEIMTYTSALPQLIRTGKASALVSLVETGKSAGMQLMDESLDKLVKAGVIDGKMAYMRALDKKRFESYLSS
jgi:twitching motility protein PilT